MNSYKKIITISVLFCIFFAVNNICYAENNIDNFKKDILSAILINFCVYNATNKIPEKSDLILEYIVNTYKNKLDDSSFNDVLVYANQNANEVVMYCVNNPDNEIPCLNALSISSEYAKKSRLGSYQMDQALEYYRNKYKQKNKQ